MPKFPTYARQVGLVGGPTASYASDSAFAAPARALAGMGDAISGMGEDFAAVENKFRETRRNSELSRATSQAMIDLETQDREAQQAATDSAVGYTESANKRFEDYRAKVLGGSKDPGFHDRFNAWADDYKARYIIRAGQFQAGAEITKRAADFETAMNNFAQVVRSDPSSYADVQKQAQAALQAAKAWMTPEQEAKASRYVEHDMQLERAKGIKEASPAFFLDEVGAADTSKATGGAAISATVDKIIGAESGGNPNAKNPNSSASGVGQFTDSTWLATVREHRPDLASRSNSELLALKGDRALGREMTTRLTEDNAKALAADGLAVTPGNLYLAHFAGIGGAKAVLRADNGASIVDVLDPAAMKANGFLNGKTVGWLKDWAAKKMSGRGVPTNYADNPNYSALSPDEIVSLARGAAEDEVARSTQAYNQLKDNWSLEMAKPDSTVSVADIMASDLNNGDKASFINTLNARDKWAGEAATLNRAIDSGDSAAGLNIFDPDDKAIGDKAYSTRIKGANAGDIAGISEDFVARTGYIPSSLSAAIRQGLLSNNAQSLSTALALADRVERASPGAYGNMADGKEAREKLARYRSLVNDRGMSGEQAAQDMLSADKPERVASREALKSDAQAFVKDLSVSDVTGMFDTWMPGDEPGPGATVPERLQLLQEYRAIAEERFYETGDKAQAKALALSDIKRTWGVSEISGSRQMMRLPPENFYPQVEGSYDYLHTDALQSAETFVKEHFPERSVSGVSIMADQQTRSEIEANKPPKYRLFYSYEQDGMTVADEVVGGRWGIDGKSLSGRMEEAQRNRGSALVDMFRATRKRMDEIRDIDARVRKVGEETVGPDWMKAKAEEAERERLRMEGVE